MASIHSEILVVKCAYGEDRRRFRVSSASSFEECVQTISRLYQLPGVYLKYIDDEGDLISISSDEEIQEAFRFALTQNPPLLRLTVIENTTVKPIVQQPQKPEQKLPNVIPSLPHTSVSSSNQPYARLIQVPCLPNSFPSAPAQNVQIETQNLKQESVPTIQSNEEWMNNYLKIFQETALQADQLAQQASQNSAELCKRMGESVSNIANQTAKSSTAWCNEFAQHAQSFHQQILTNQNAQQNSLAEFLNNLNLVASNTCAKTSELSQSIAENSIKLAEASAKLTDQIQK